MRNNFTLAFVEFAQDVHYLAKKGLFDKGIKIIALGAEAVIELKRMYIPFNCPEDFISKEEINYLIDKSLDESERLLSFFIEEMREICDIDKLLGSFEGPFWKFYANITIKRYELIKILDTCNPSLIYFFQAVPYPINNDLTLNHRESYYSHLIPDILKEYSEKIHGVPLKRKGRLNYHGWWIFIRKALVTLRDLISKRKKGLYDWTLILEGCRDADIFMERANIKHFSWLSPNRLPFNPFEVRLKKIISLVKNIYYYYKYKIIFSNAWYTCQTKAQEKHSLFSEMMRCPIWERIMNRVFINILPLTKIVWDESKKLFKKNNIKAVISSDGFYHYSKIVLNAALEAGIPRICIQHGLFDFTRNAFSRYELFNSFSFLFTFGEKVYRNNEAPSLSIKTVGSLWFEEVVRKKNDKERKGNFRILYPLNIWAKGFINYNYLGSTHYIKIVMKILDFLATFEDHGVDIYVKAKTYADIYGSQDMLFKRYKKYSHMKFFSKGYTSDYVYDCDIMLLDWPSTSVIEGIAADMDIFILNCTSDAIPIAKTMLSKRVFYTEEEDIFFDKLKKVIEEGVQKKVKRYDDISEFELGYISPSRDGKNINRYIKAFEEIVSTST